MKKIVWIPKKLPEKQQIENLSAQLNNAPRAIVTILLQREIDDYEKSKEFFRPDLTMLHDPFLMKGMEKAVERIHQAISLNEHIVFYGDYDVDGTTSVALIYLFFKKIYTNISYYVPDRYKEGYGISEDGINEAKNRNAKLMIALDCGIRATDKVAYASTLGIDFIICDHHLPGDEIPAAIAVLDAKQKDCEYPFKELSGCGVGFKLCEAYCKKHNIDTQELFNLLDLLAVSIASDLVVMTGENRILMSHGLLKMNSNPTLGIKTLLERYKRKKEFTVSDVVFFIGPRINAAGRMKHAAASVDLLIETDIEKANTLADELIVHNTDRQTTDQKTTIEAITEIENDIAYSNKKSTVVYRKDWSKGVVGIVASRLIEKYYKPTIVLAEHEGTITGSARSVNGFDIHAAIDSCKHLLLHYGGHYHAAGLSLLPENLEQFVEEFEMTVSKTINHGSQQQIITYDTEVSFDEITPRFMSVLKQMAPFGPGNMAPVFVTKNVKVIANPQMVGGNHLKLYMEDKSGKRMGGIAFGFGEYYHQIKYGTKIDICYHTEENIYNNQTSTQLNLKDLTIVGAE